LSGAGGLAVAPLTGAILVLPQGVAFATIAGMPPEFGLYAGMVPAMIAALFGSSRHLVSGPTTTASVDPVLGAVCARDSRHAQHVGKFGHPKKLDLVPFGPGTVESRARPGRCEPGRRIE
jgi:hypothetical protein